MAVAPRDETEAYPRAAACLPSLRMLLGSVLARYAGKLFVRGDMKQLCRLVVVALLAGCARQPELRTVASIPAPPALVTVSAADPRPLPPPIDVPAAFRHAIEKGTRTTTGQPGPKY